METLKALRDQTQREIEELDGAELFLPDGSRFDVEARIKDARRRLASIEAAIAKEQ